MQDATTCELVLLNYGVPQGLRNNELKPAKVCKYYCSTFLERLVLAVGKLFSMLSVCSLTVFTPIIYLFPQLDQYLFETNFARLSRVSVPATF